MLAERVHVVEMNAGDIMHKWRKRKEKGKLQLGILSQSSVRSHPQLSIGLTLERGRETHNDPMIAMQTPQSQSVASPAFAKV